MNVNNVVLNGTIKMKQVEQILEEHGAPYTPGWFPEWRKN
jgi:hypothetical protein